MKMKIVEVYDDITKACDSCRNLNGFDRNYKFSVRKNKNKFEILEDLSCIPIFRTKKLEERRKIINKKMPKILQLRRTGKTWKEIEELTGISVSCCMYWRKKYVEAGDEIGLSGDI